MKQKSDIKMVSLYSTPTPTYVEEETDQRFQDNRIVSTDEVS